MNQTPQVQSQPMYEQYFDNRKLKLKKKWSDLKWFIETQRAGTISLIILLLLFLLAIFAPVIAPYDPLTQHRDAIMNAPSMKHIMGTDDLGRDIFSRIIFGARISLTIGISVIIGSMMIGTILGIVSGYFGGKIDMIIQRIIDTIMAVPTLILALFIAALLGSAIQNVILAIIIVKTPQFARIARGEMLRLREENYIEAARAAGASTARILFKHGIPNMMASLIVLASLTFGQAVIIEAALSFLGIGTPPPNPSWGLMLSGASGYSENAPWMVIFPGLAISILVLALNILGDALRDYFDPKLS